MVKVNKNQQNNQLNHVTSNNTVPLLLNKRNTMTTKMKQLKCDLCLLYFE